MKREMTETYVPVVMVRRDLQELPIRSLPARYSLRWYTPGDATHWVDIQSRADALNRISAVLFDAQFAERGELPKRQAFILDESGRPAGSATAWFGDCRGTKMGRVHWVAVLPEHQGRGLGSALMSVVCSRLRDLGHAAAYLTTDERRTMALGLYVRFGFVRV
ncbi:MAG: GNAT family N-acetyltransferase [Alphaproteobacteria bacterium]|nr:GNAT family N-acetyltransferase [Alphaproteobacteria bacterium]